ncbi:MAG: hypothetical protein HC769_17755 [Cyanobacteria bacterium CRU_2_1]|nr:hypothetical protein [Cyanobacteria bacterium CRU_2_1]
MKLGELLVRKRLISQAQLEQSLAWQASNHQMLGDLLLEQSLISPDDLCKALQEQYWRNNGFWVIG